MALAVRKRPGVHARRILEAVEQPQRSTGQPALFVLVGLPGVGKSTFAQGLSSLTGAIVLESDRFRQLLFETPSFSASESGALFRAIRAAAQALLEEDYAVVIDATNLSKSDRQPFYELADLCKTPLFVIVLDAPAEVVEARLRRRLREGNSYSYADIDVYHRMRGRVEPVSREHWTIDTSHDGSSRAAMAAIADKYRELRGKGVRVIEQ